VSKNVRRIADLTVDVGGDRDDWTFPYRGEDIAAAAQRQADYHQKRLDHWSAEADRLEEAVREGSVEVREQQVTGGVQFTAVLDQNLGAQLSTARSKRDYHRGRQRTFASYAAAFGAAGQTGMSHHLSIEDIDFFALHREPGD
jgi:hypothetical protein